MVEWIAKLVVDLWPLWVGLAVFFAWVTIQGFLNLRKFILHEGGWIQLEIGRRILWLTVEAYESCYIGLDDRARSRVDRALVDSGQRRIDRVALERIAR